ncbi:MAG: hypothetical protein OXR72_05290 [Gemmatimonadota bacterium]|nr:hypothetical protein [Gemmatimonadota bacterium]
MPSSGNGLAQQIAELFQELLERELQSVKRAVEVRRIELLEKIGTRETELNDDDRLDALFDQYKAGLAGPERPASRVQERRLYYNWEGRLRSELGTWRVELDELEKRSNDDNTVLTNARCKVMRLLLRETLLVVNRGCINGPKSDKGEYESLEDCLIPVIREMKKGKSHTEAFRIVAERLGARRTTVASVCTRGLDLTTEQFVDHVTSGRIVQVLKKKYPEKTGLIDRELDSLYP